jgi:hypothetical protein
MLSFHQVETDILSAATQGKVGAVAGVRLPNHL